MGEGLKRAFAAARATRQEHPLKPDAIEMQLFIGALVRQGGSASRSGLPLASRDQDRVRKKAKQMGWAFYHAGSWHVTDAGRSAYNPNLR